MTIKNFLHVTAAQSRETLLFACRKHAGFLEEHLAECEKVMQNPKNDSAVLATHQEMVGLYSAKIRLIEQIQAHFAGAECGLSQEDINILNNLPTLK